jgi:beta-aspartyl-peptidase (threonine type)
VVHVDNKHVEGDIGLIAIDVKGNISMEFNSEKMHRGYKVSGKKPYVKIYRD